MQLTSQITTDACASCAAPYIEDSCPECHAGYCAVCLPTNIGPYHPCNVPAPKPVAQKVRVVLSALLAGITIQIDTGHGIVSIRLFQTGQTILMPTEEFILFDAFWLGQVVQVTNQGKPPINMHVGSHMSFADVLNAASEMSDDSVALLAADLALNKANQESRAPRGWTLQFDQIEEMRVTIIQGFIFVDNEKLQELATRFDLSIGEAQLIFRLEPRYFLEYLALRLNLLRDKTCPGNTIEEVSAHTHFQIELAALRAQERDESNY